MIGHGEKLKGGQGWCWHVPIPTPDFLLEGEGPAAGTGQWEWTSGPVRVMEGPWFCATGWQLNLNSGKARGEDTR